MQGSLIDVLQSACFEKLLAQRLKYFRGVEGIVIVKVVYLYSKGMRKEENVSKVHEKVLVDLGYPQQCQDHNRDGVRHSADPSLFTRMWWRPSASGQENYQGYDKKITCGPKGKAPVIQHRERTKPQQRKKDQNVSVTREYPVPYPGRSDREYG